MSGLMGNKSASTSGRTALEGLVIHKLKEQL